MIYSETSPVPTRANGPLGEEMSVTPKTPGTMSSFQSYGWVKMGPRFGDGV